MLSRVVSSRVATSSQGLRLFSTAPLNDSAKAAEFMAIEDKYGAQNYHPLPVVLMAVEYLEFT